MENPRTQASKNPTLLQKEPHEYILKNSLQKEPKHLKELRIATANHSLAFMATSPEVGQFMTMLLKLVNPKNTIEIGVFTRYSLLLTAQAIPDDGKVDYSQDSKSEPYERGLPIVKKAGEMHKIDFIKSRALSVLDELLKNPEKEGSFDFAFVDADKDNYWNYHNRLMKLVKIGGMVIYDNTLWGGTVALPELDVEESKREYRESVIEFNSLVCADRRVEMCQIPLGDDGLTICRRIC